MLLWFALFTLLFLLSQGLWLWTDELLLGPLNYPIWVFFFLALQIALACLLIAFSLSYWETNSTRPDDHTRE